MAYARRFIFRKWSYVFVSIYIHYFLDKGRYLNGITRRYRYNTAPITSLSRVVYSAEMTHRRSCLMSGQFRDILQWWCAEEKDLGDVWRQLQDEEQPGLVEQGEQERLQEQGEQREQEE